VSFNDSALPAILVQLRRRDGGLLTPATFAIDSQETLNPDYLDEAFRRFVVWACNSKGVLRRWLQLHAEAWISDGHLARVRPRYVFDVDRLRGGTSLREVASAVSVSEDDILYAFDVVLRYPLYGELAGPDSFFLAHPIREQQTLPTMTIETTSAPQVALSLSDTVAAMAPSMTLDDYTSFLHEARGLIRDRKIHTLKHGALDRDTIREIAASLALPARLSAVGKTMDIAAGAIAVAGLLPVLGTPAAISGAIVTVASALWPGTVGRGLSRMSWIRWALTWDVERQASDASRNSEEGR